MKSVITCDMEGRVLTMNNDAESIFGYSKSEIIGKKRVSIFSPGEIVIQNVGNWLATADKFGEYVGQTYFLKKDVLVLQIIAGTCIFSSELVKCF